MSSISNAAFVELLKCPFQWDEVCPIEELCYWLNYAWYKTVVSHKVVDEHLYFSCDWMPCEEEFELMELSADERRSLAINIDTWRERARDSYQRKFRALHELRVARPSDYPKHYSPPDCSDEGVAELSVRRGEGILYPCITVDRQREYMWSALLELWISQGYAALDDNDLDGPEVVSLFESLFTRKGLTMGREFCENIGCCRGKPSRYGAVKYDFSAALFHMHPTSQEEASRYEFLVSGWTLH